MDSWSISITPRTHDVFQPWHILLATLYGRVNQRQQQFIEFQNDQIEVLLKNIGKKRLLLTADPAWPSRFMPFPRIGVKYTPEDSNL